MLLCGDSPINLLLLHEEMDFGVVSLKQTSPNAGCLGSAQPRDERGHGSVNLKHQRSEDFWTSNKMLKPSQVDFSSADAFAAFGRSNLWPPPPLPDDGQKMLSFSSPAPQCGGGTPDGGGSGRSIAFSICHDESNTRTGGGGLRGSFSRLKGPFTPSQWMELEHQALIYKHIVANVPVPSNLLVPLKRSLYSYGSPAVYTSNFLGWGPFHLGFSGSNDPEPGRCRRTDGKKWRCSRDAVPDQKYCERHINRGRHRSRKPVEGQTGHASKLPSIASSSSPSPVQPNPSNPNTSTERSKVFRGLSLIPPTVDLKSKEAPFSVQKQYEESSNLEFGIVSSDCLLNPSEKISYMNNGSNSDSLMRLNTKEAGSQHPVHHFIDDWPKDESDRGSGSWPEELKSDWTRLSMSIPIAPDFSSSSTSPAQEKSTLPSLRLSHEADPIQMSLGMSRGLGQSVEKQLPWSPIIWGNSMGGPLGEVLTSTNTGASVCPDFSCTKDREMGSSPTGVLQKSSFVSLSTSSSAGSPTNAENSKALCNNMIGSALSYFCNDPVSLERRH